MYEYRCTILRVVDGDTVAVRVDLGFSVQCEQHIRLMDVNAPEVVGTDKAFGIAAKEYLIEALHEHGWEGWRLNTVKDKRSFNRYVGTLMKFPERLYVVSLNDLMTDWLITQAALTGEGDDE